MMVTQELSKIDPVTRVNILGVNISAINMRMAVETIDGWIQRRESHYVTVTPAHGIMDCLNNPELRRIFNRSGMTTPDGMAVVWLLKLNGHRNVCRVYGPDLMLAVCERSVHTGYRHFFYGGQPGVADELTLRLKGRFPGLQIAGTNSPPFRSLTPQEDEGVIADLNAARPDIVWIGISTPKQERWMADHIGRLEAPVLIGVGAAFDFLSGVKRQAPRWMQRSGLEWLFRLASEPRRLSARYAQYPRFVLLAAAQLLGIRHFPEE